MADFPFFLGLNNILVCVCVYTKNYMPYFLYPFIHPQTFRLFQLSQLIGNNATMNMRVLISLQDPDFNYFEHIARSEIAGSYGSFP